MFKSGLRKWKNAMNHDIPVNATFTLFKYLQVTPSFTYRERWYTKKIMKGYDIEKKQLVPTDTLSKFSRIYDYDMSLQFNTKLYGMYKPLFAKIGKSRSGML